MVVTQLIAKPMALPVEAPPPHPLQSVTELSSPALTPFHKPMESVWLAVYAILTHFFAHFFYTLPGLDRTGPGNNHI